LTVGIGRKSLISILKLKKAFILGREEWGRLLKKFGKKGSRWVGQPMNMSNLTAEYSGGSSQTGQYGIQGLLPT